MLQKHNTPAKIDSKIGTDKYPEFSKSVKNVLEVAKKEINEKTGIKFTYTPKKTGSKVNGLEFKIASHLKVAKSTGKG